MIRRFGEPVRPNILYRHRPGAYAILVQNGMVLLTYQAAPKLEYQLPGGGIDPGEQTLPALHREVLEETGWHIGGCRRLGTYRRFTYMEEYDLWAEKLCHIYTARPHIRVGQPTEDDHTAIWTTPDDAVALLANEGDALFLADALL